ncbi:hypothetical protein [Aneurinibacillus migulanus]|nr:hypothetical protein [Aneurinibacillus migulanus]
MRRSLCGHAADMPDEEMSSHYLPQPLEVWMPGLSRPIRSQGHYMSLK